MMFVSNVLFVVLTMLMDAFTNRSLSCFLLRYNYNRTAPPAAWSRQVSPPPLLYLSGLGLRLSFRVRMLLGSMVSVVPSGEFLFHRELNV